jgi:hypothetical protein
MIGIKGTYSRKSPFLAISGSFEEGSAHMFGVGYKDGSRT